MSITWSNTKIALAEFSDIHQPLKEKFSRDTHGGTQIKFFVSKSTCLPSILSHLQRLNQVKLELSDRQLWQCLCPCLQLDLTLSVPSPNRGGWRQEAHLASKTLSFTHIWILDFYFITARAKAFPGRDALQQNPIVVKIHSRAFPKSDMLPRNGEKLARAE